MVISFVIGKYEGRMDQSTLEGGKWVKTYMACKLIKVVLILAFIGLGLSFITDSNQKVEFASCTIAFYLLGLGAESLVLRKG